jgi:hypothetical protein
VSIVEEPEVYPEFMTRHWYQFKKEAPLLMKVNIQNKSADTLKVEVRL